MAKRRGMDSAFDHGGDLDLYHPDEAEVFARRGKKQINEDDDD